MAINTLFFSEGNGLWMCQSLDLDYSAAGTTEDEARLNFWRGLAETFYEHQKRFGTCEKLIQPLSKERWDEIEKRVRSHSNPS